MFQNTKFCSVCGSALQEEVAAAGEQSRVQPPSQAGGEPNPYVERGKDLSKNYWAFVVENLKKPSSNGEKTSGEVFANGCITLFFLALFFGLGGYFQLESINLGIFTPEVTFSKSFFTLFFYGVGSALITSGALFMVIKFLMNADIRFHDVIARFGALSTVPLALMAFYFLVSLLGLSKFAFIILLFAVVGLQMAIVVSLFSFRKTARSDFDPFFGLFIVFSVFGLYFWLTSDIFTEYFLALFIPVGFW